MSLRILHVTPYFTEAWAYGGIPRVAAAQVRGLMRLGHQVTVVTTDVRDADSRVRSGSHDPEVDVHVFPNLSNRLAFHWQCYLPRGMSRFLDCTIEQGFYRQTLPIKLAEGRNGRKSGRSGLFLHNKRFEMC